MADEDQIHDEYQLADLDGLDAGSTDTAQSSDEGVTFPEKKTSMHSVNVKRNAIIAVSVFIFAIIVYKFVSSHSTDDSQSKMNKLAASNDQSKTPPVFTPTPAIQPQVITTAPSQSQSATMVGTEDSSKISQKLSAMELSQQSMRDDFTSVSNQLGGINNNVHEMMTKMAEVTRAVANLSAVAEAQSREIERLVAAKTKRMQQQKAPPESMTAPVKYFIQAVIPGRAWLVATNGNSITVRVGSPVSGYGVVKLIDAVQGRVMTSSGQMIRFSQADS